MASVFQRQWKTAKGEKRSSWRVQFYVGGKPKYRDFPTERKARRFHENVGPAQVVERAKEQAGRGPRIEQVAREWLAACRRGRDGMPPLEPETVAWYAGHVANHIAPALGSLRVGSLTRDTVRDFRDGLLDGPLSRNTAKKILTTLKTLAGFAIQEGYLVADPTHKVDVRLSSRDRARVEIHSKAEMLAIFAAAERLRASINPRVRRTWARYWPLLHTLVYAGLRLSEARGLERDAVGPHTITIRQRADKRGRIGAPKTAQAHRRIHIPDDAAAAIRDWLVAHNHPLVFPTDSGLPIDGNNIRKRLWNAVQVEADVRVLTLHSARHFFASREIERGTNLKELCTLMGHADEAFTLRTYGHLFQDRASEARRRKEANERVLA